MPSIQGFLSQYLTPKKPEPPPINLGTAAALLVAYTLAYVLPFYVSPRTRPSRSLSRDAPSVIRARITSVSLTCLFCTLSTLVILTRESGGRLTRLDAVHSLGYWPVGLADSIRALLLTAILFAGPLFETFVVDSAWREWMTLQPVYELFGEWTTWRNIVAGPFTEEVLFRSASVPLMLLAHASVTKTIFLSPVIFGLAHVHHFYEFRLTHPQVPVIAAVMRSAVQFAYTTLFGAYATFIFLRSGSLLAIFAVHAFCNCMGFPRFWGRIMPSEVRYGDSDAKEQDGKPKSYLGFTITYYVLLVLGAVLWWRNLWALTESSNALVPFDV